MAFTIKKIKYLIFIHFFYNQKNYFKNSNNTYINIIFYIYIYTEVIIIVFIVLYLYIVEIVYYTNIRERYQQNL